MEFYHAFPVAVIDEDFEGKKEKYCRQCPAQLVQNPSADAPRQSRILIRPSCQIVYAQVAGFLRQRIALHAHGFALSLRTEELDM